MPFTSLIITVVYLLAYLIAATLTIKTILFFRFEKEWDILVFFYFPELAIKMTNIRHLKVWRKRQNSLSKVFLILLILLGAITMFKSLIIS